MTEGDVPPFDLIGERYTKDFSERSAQLEAGAWLIEQLPRPARVLELGSGTGIPAAEQFVAAGLDVVGLDESSVMVDLARRNVPQAEFRHQDMRALDAELGEFDAVVAFFSLLMLPRKDIAATLRAARDRLTGPGLLLLSMVHGDMDDFAILFMGSPMRVSAYPPADLRQVVTDAGFEVLDVQEREAEVEPNRIETHIYLRAVKR